MSPRDEIEHMDHKQRSDGGFTIVEMMVVIAITAFVFLALAALLAGAARSLAISKLRSQANEVATQGIEDLQRYDFNDLASVSVRRSRSGHDPREPHGLSSVQLANCASASIVYEAAVHASGGTLTRLRGAPADVLVRARKTTFNVSRYSCGRRLTHREAVAVYLSWTDQAAAPVAQESSFAAERGERHRAHASAVRLSDGVCAQPASLRPMERCSRR